MAVRPVPTLTVPGLPVGDQVAPWSVVRNRRPSAAVTVALRASVAATDTRSTACRRGSRARTARHRSSPGRRRARPTSQHTVPPGDEPAASDAGVERQRRRRERRSGARRELDGCRPDATPAAGAVGGDHDQVRGALRAPRRGGLGAGARHAPALAADSCRVGGRRRSRGGPAPATVPCGGLRVNGAALAAADLARRRRRSAPAAWRSRRSRLGAAAAVEPPRGAPRARRRRERLAAPAARRAASPRACRRRLLCTAASALRRSRVRRRRTCSRARWRSTRACSASRACVARTLGAAAPHTQITSAAAAAAAAGTSHGRRSRDHQPARRRGSRARA